MKSSIKELLSEMLEYISSNNQTLKHLKKADKKLNGRSEIYHLVRDLINFIDPVTLQLEEDQEKIHLYGDEGLDYENYVKKMGDFFKYIPILSEIYSLEKEFIKLQSKLSKDEIEEIKIFINDNRKREVVNFYTPIKPRERE